jgi:threonine dehydrogenase-like Zn-dependent dehydrogenase
MRAITIQPSQRDSLRLEEIPEPASEGGSLLIQMLALGVCGTDREIIAGEYGQTPDGSGRLILGHESLGRVLEASSGSGLMPGDLVVGIVRHPDPVPCSNCAVGEWDMCRNGLYTECGINGRHGFGAEFLRADPKFVVKVAPKLGLTGVLLEPTSVLAKAWEHIERIGTRADWRPRKVLVTGAGPVGLLAALFGVQRGLEVHVLDRATDGPKPELVHDLGAIYHHSSVREAGEGADIVIECTGAAGLIFDALDVTGRNGIVCLTGISSGGRRMQVDAGLLNRTMVLENDVVFGSVNANRRHYERAALALAQADPAWLNKLITRRVPLGRWHEAYERRPGDVKTVIDFVG